MEVSDSSIACFNACLNVSEEIPRFSSDVSTVWSCPSKSNALSFTFFKSPPSPINLSPEIPVWSSRIFNAFLTTSKSLNASAVESLKSIAFFTCPRPSTTNAVAPKLVAYPQNPWNCPPAVCATSPRFFIFSASVVNPPFPAVSAAPPISPMIVGREDAVSKGKFKSFDANEPIPLAKEKILVAISLAILIANNVPNAAPTCFINSGSTPLNFSASQLIAFAIPLIKSAPILIIPSSPVINASANPSANGWNADHKFPRAVPTAFQSTLSIKFCIEVFTRSILLQIQFQSTSIIPKLSSAVTIPANPSAIDA